MFLRDKDKPMVSKLLQFTSYLAAFFSFVGALGTDLFLASTQWLLIAAVLSVWGIYLLVEAEFRS